ncbi:MAG: hypothetical protein HKO93_04545, partial [Flavobacteriales bacterium]|nr:hypothetical protein [Flavobacteriales bacterium]
MAQETDLGSISGNVEVTAQYYLEDEVINAALPDPILGMNSYTNLIYNRGNFSAGIRYESYLGPLAGYPPGFEGTGLGYRYASFTNEELSVTVGNFYEQYGSGMLLRSYEERTLGLDNALDGIKATYKPATGITLRGMVGKHRRRFDNGLINGEGIIRGFDAEMDINSLIPKMEDSELRLSIAGSFVSKFNDQNNIDTLILPKNVGAYGARLSADYKNWRFTAEFNQKENDPVPYDNDQFDYIYSKGKGAILTLDYSTKGFGVGVTAKYMDNMIWRSTNLPAGLTELLIGYIPALNRQHTYNLAATLYPYVTNLYGEVSLGADVLYTIPKGSELGGKYGTKIALNGVANFAPKRTYLNDEGGRRLGHTAKLFAIEDSLFAHDYNITVSKKFNKKVKGIFAFYNFEFDDRVSLVAVIHERIFANIAVADITWKFKPKHALRFELQGLWTEQDQGDWAFAQVEYSMSPHWFIAILDQYNYGNADPDKRYHYALGNVGYVNGANR